MNSAKRLDETGMFTFESIFIFTLFGKFERWVLFVVEGRTLTIPQLPLAGFKRSGCIAGFGSGCKERKAESFSTSGDGAEDGKSSQLSKRQDYVNSRATRL
jgi:hypothetical protein